MQLSLFLSPCNNVTLSYEVSQPASFFLHQMLPSVCSPPHPHDTEGFNTFELNSFGLYPEEAPLLFSIQRDRVKGRVVAELGEHSVGQLSGRARAVDVVAEERRTAAPTARTTDLSMTVQKYLDVQRQNKQVNVLNNRLAPQLLLLQEDYRKHVWKDTLTSRNYDLCPGNNTLKAKIVIQNYSLYLKKIPNAVGDI